MFVGYAGTIAHLHGVFPTLGGGECSPAGTLYCNHTVTGSTHGRPAAVAQWLGASRQTPGPEAYHRLDVPYGGEVTVRLTPTSADLDLLVLGADGSGGCDRAAALLGASQTAGQAVEQVGIPLSGARSLFVVADGASSESSAYQLEVTCTKQP